MRYAQISVLITAVFICLLSCRETIGEQHNSLPKENTAPSQRQKIEIPSQKDTASRPKKTPQEKEIKKKKKKASDTLKPKLAQL